MFRAKYVAENYAAIRSADEAVEALSAARASGRGVACVGGGSNIFFVSRKVESFVLKNELPETIEYLGGDKFRVSASVPSVSANDKTLAENARIGARLLLLFGERAVPDRGRSCYECWFRTQRGFVGIRLYRKC